MRKVFILVAIGLFVFAATTRAQESSSSAQTATATPTPSGDAFTYEIAYKDYVFMVDQYNKAHADYLLSRAQYLQAKTLASQTKARDATAVMIAARDDVLTTYLVALRMRLSETAGVTETTRGGLFTRLDTDVAWWKNHKQRINSAGTLEDLVNDSTLAVKHYPVTEALAYEVLSTIPLGKAFELRTTLNTILSNTKSKVSQIRGVGDHDVNQAERSILEVDQKLTRSLEKEIDAQKIISTLILVDDKQTSKKADAYNQVLFRLNESQQFLKEATSFMKEVMKQIKFKS